MLFRPKSSFQGLRLFFSKSFGFVHICRNCRIKKLNHLIDLDMTPCSQKLLTLAVVLSPTNLVSDVLLDFRDRNHRNVCWRLRKGAKRPTFRVKSKVGVIQNIYLQQS